MSWYYWCWCHLAKFLLWWKFRIPGKPCGGLLWFSIYGNLLRWAIKILHHVIECFLEVFNILFTVTALEIHVFPVLFDLPCDILTNICHVNILVSAVHPLVKSNCPKSIQSILQAVQKGSKPGAKTSLDQEICSPQGFHYLAIALLVKGIHVAVYKGCIFWPLDHVCHT